MKPSQTQPAIKPTIDDITEKNKQPKNKVNISNSLHAKNRELHFSCQEKNENN
jgi:hypothetical protein